MQATITTSESATSPLSLRRRLLTERSGVVAYWALAAIPVVITLLLPSLVLTDGGMHLASATALNGLVDGQWPGLVEWTGTLPPNLLVELVLAGLIRFMDPMGALQLVAAALLIGFAAGVRAVVRSLRAPAVAGILFLPFQANFLFEVGLLSFTAAVALVAAWIGAWRVQRAADHARVGEVMRVAA